jgi:hypothetical protein
MAQIEIVENKYRRTYAGRSKKKENEIFLKVQGTKKDNSDCDWLEYRRILFVYLKDVITVLSSWKQYCLIESYLFLFSSIIFLKTQYALFILLGIAIIFQILHFIFSEKEKEFLRAYDMSQTILLNEIKKNLGFDLDKI